MGKHRRTSKSPSPSVHGDGIYVPTFYAIFPKLEQNHGTLRGVEGNLKLHLSILMGTHQGGGGKEAYQFICFDTQYSSFPKTQTFC